VTEKWLGEHNTPLLSKMGEKECKTLSISLSYERKIRVGRKERGMSYFCCIYKFRCLEKYWHCMTIFKDNVSLNSLGYMGTVQYSRFHKSRDQLFDEDPAQIELVCTNRKC
jgi:hypothetical protein